LHPSNFNNGQDANGIKAARNMGFPNMKYLDPETKGAPV
jgi:hypothetical protein